VCTVSQSESGKPRLPVERLTRDSSPWIVAQKDWHGLALAETGDISLGNSNGDSIVERFETLDRTLWMLRNDTFPSNLAIFRPGNFSIGTDNIALLTMREQRTAVREFTSASIASRQRYLYGRFVAEVRPS